MPARLAAVIAVGLLVTAVQADDPPKTADKPTQKADKPASKAEKLAVTVEGDVDAELAPVAGQLVRLSYECYPKLLTRFEDPDRPAPRRLRIVFVDGLKVPAQCSGNKVEVSTGWLRKNPNDVALITHELTHAVQMYPKGGPGWLTEGIADYARQEYGPKDQANWKLPAKLTSRQKYTDAYRVTARFLVWLETRTPGVVDKLHRAMQKGEYKPDLFEQVAGRPVQALWDECVADLSKQ